jgi:carbon monoxide dehydrogenase subunit G
MGFLAMSLVAVAALQLTDPELAAVGKGEVPVRIEAFKNANGKSAGRGWGAIAIERPVAEVWATLARYDDRAEYVPRLKSVTVLEQAPGRARIRQEIDASLMTARYTAWYTFDEGQRSIAWTIDKSAADNTVKQVDGDYRMAELGPTRTLLVYRAYVDSGMHVPQSIQSFMQRRSIPDLLRAIKRRVESGGRWKK